MTNTLADSFDVQGTGLHTGAKTNLELQPAPAGNGVTFRRTDLGGDTLLASLDFVTSTQRRTVLGKGAVQVATVEHLLACLYAHGITDVAIAIDGPEIPQLDGSAKHFSECVQRVGVVRNGDGGSSVTVDDRIAVTHKDSTYTVEPAEVLDVDVTIEWDHPVVGRQAFATVVAAQTFDRELAGARTFGFLNEMERLQQRGLIRGVTKNSVVALSETAIVYGHPLRWPNEFVRHKTLDLIGDLALLGRPLAAKITAFRPSHAGNVELARAIQARVRQTPSQRVIATSAIGKVADGD